MTIIRSFADHCPATYCQEIVHLAGDILVSITDEIPETHDTIVKSGLVLALLCAPRCFTDQQEITEVHLTSQILCNAYGHIT